ncbi:MAG: PadR family transcriptional regulator [Frankiaceae bacterium]|nr:PadR family transcriptional regulator [Frankiaceae bacterium]
MPRRRAGVLLPLELELLDALLSTPDQHGFALGQELTAHGGRSILGHGTLYKALGRLEAAGLLTSHWESGDASALGRPLRRLYRVTTDGRAALAAARPVRTRSTRPGLVTP